MTQKSPNPMPLSPDAAELYPGPLVALDKEARLLFANQAAARLFARPRAGLPLEMFARWPALREAFEFLIAGGDKGSFPLHLPVPVARHFTIHARRGGNYYLLFLEEITQSLRSQQLRSEFIADISHEIKTPLAVLRLGLGELAQEKGAVARQNLSTLLDKQAGRMAALVDRLISLARIEAHEHKPPQDTIDMGALAREAVALMTKQAKEKHMTLTLEMGDNLPPVTGDGDELMQLLLNLLENALTHGCRKHGAVVLALAVEGKTVRLSVRDDGPGIEEDYLPRLTERFFRSPPAQGQPARGAGLGLAIVKHILARHHASLKIHSQRGEGARFETLLPIAGY